MKERRTWRCGNCGSSDVFILVRHTHGMNSRPKTVKRCNRCGSGSAKRIVQRMPRYDRLRRED